MRGRKNERPKGAATQIAEEDKAAARVLAGKGKKKKKKENVPFYQAVWFQACCIVALLGAIGLTLFLLLQPPSPQKLHEQAKKLMASDNPDDWELARNGPIKTYLAHYGQRKGVETDYMNQMLQEIDVFKDEDLLLRYLRKKSSPIKMQAQVPAEEKGFKAIDAEDAGDLVDARKQWLEMTKEFGSGSGYKDWGTLAEQHVAMLDYIKELEEALREDYNRIAEMQAVPATLAPSLPRSMERQNELQEIFLALRYQWFGDLVMAKQHFADMHEKYEKKDKKTDVNRICQVLAKAKLRELTKELNPQSTPTPKERFDYVEKKLVAAAKANPHKAFAIYQDIVKLYANEDRMKDLVATAKGKLQNDN